VIQRTLDPATGVTTQATVDLGTISVPVLYRNYYAPGDLTTFAIGINAEVVVATSIWVTSAYVYRLRPLDSTYAGLAVGPSVWCHPHPAYGLHPIGPADGSAWMPGIGTPLPNFPAAG
jgi:hypothetical protein